MGFALFGAVILVLERRAFGGFQVRASADEFFDNPEGFAFCEADVTLEVRRFLLAGFFSEDKVLDVVLAFFAERDECVLFVISIVV